MALLAISLLSCSKKDKVESDIPVPKDIPAWLQTYIAEIKKDENPGFYRVAEYKIDGTIYYSIAAPYMSCLFCQLFEVGGERAQIDFTEQTSIEKIRTIWPVGFE